MQKIEHAYDPGQTCPAPNSSSLCLNVYRPTPHTLCLPTVLWIHGGGWSLAEGQLVHKDSQFNDDMCVQLASNGLFVVSCNYTLSSYKPCIDPPPSGSTTYLETIRDIKRVIDWIRGEGKTIYGFSDTIVVAGSSAGAHLAAMMATTGGGNAMYDPHLGNHYDVDYAILFSPPLNFVRMGCEGIEYGEDCFNQCVQQPASYPCGQPACGPAARVGAVLPGYPCADGPNEVCNQSVFQEGLIGELWQPWDPPLDIGAQSYGCADELLFESLSMPTGNPWFDASPYFWVSGNEPDMEILQEMCDAQVSYLEGLQFRDRMIAKNPSVHCNVNTLLPTSCAACMHSADFFPAITIANTIRNLIETRYL